MAHKAYFFPLHHPLKYPLVCSKIWIDKGFKFMNLNCSVTDIQKKLNFSGNISIWGPWALNFDQLKHGFKDLFKKKQ